MSHNSNWQNPSSPSSQGSSSSSTTPYTYTSSKGCKHIGDVAVKVGDLEIFLGADRDLKPKDFDNFDLVVPLCGQLGAGFGRHFEVLSLYLQDYGGVPDTWGAALQYLIDRLREGKKTLAYCVGGHGRTGTLLASLIALLEPEVEDPVAEARTRHCSHAVESEGQIKGIFKLKGIETVPEKYKNFSKYSSSSTYSYMGYSSSSSHGDTNDFSKGDRVRVIAPGEKHFGKEGDVLSVNTHTVVVQIVEGKITTTSYFFPRELLILKDFAENDRVQIVACDYADSGKFGTVTGSDLKENKVFVLVDGGDGKSYYFKPTDLKVQPPFEKGDKVRVVEKKYMNYDKVGVVLSSDSTRDAIVVSFEEKSTSNYVYTRKDLEKYVAPKLVTPPITYSGDFGDEYWNHEGGVQQTPTGEIKEFFGYKVEDVERVLMRLNQDVSDAPALISRLDGSKIQNLWCLAPDIASADEAVDKEIERQLLEILKTPGSEPKSTPSVFIEVSDVVAVCKKLGIQPDKAQDIFDKLDIGKIDQALDTAQSLPEYYELLHDAIQEQIEERAEDGGDSQLNITDVELVLDTMGLKRELALQLYFRLDLKRAERAGEDASDLGPPNVAGDNWMIGAYTDLEEQILEFVTNPETTETPLEEVA